LLLLLFIGIPLVGLDNGFKEPSTDFNQLELQKQLIEKMQEK